MSDGTVTINDGELRITKPSEPGFVIVIPPVVPKVPLTLSSSTPNVVLSVLAIDSNVVFVPPTPVSEMAAAPVVLTVLPPFIVRKPTVFPSSPATPDVVMSAFTKFTMPMLF